MTTTELQQVLVSRNPLPVLTPTHVWDPKLSSLIDALDGSELVKAGLHLWNDDLARCHAIAQRSEDPDHNYWHAIMHRREKEFDNSLYWYGRVEAHPVLGLLKQLHRSWDVERFVESCRVAGTGGEEFPGLLPLQAEEMYLLYTHCASITQG